MAQILKGRMKLLTKESWQYNPNTQQNIDLKKEAQLRKESIKFMMSLGVESLHLPLSTVQKAIVIFQRYCQNISFKDFDRFLMGTVSILLMAKDDYHQRRLEDTIKSFLIVAQKQKLIQFNKYVDPNRLDTKEQQDTYLQKLGPKAITMHHENFQNAEIEILQMSGYDLVVEVTSKYLEIFKKRYTGITDRVAFQDLLQHAEDNSNTIYMSNLCLYYHPMILTVVAIQAAADKLNVNLPNIQLETNEQKQEDDDFGDIDIPVQQAEWWQMFSKRIQKEDINDCMKFYQNFTKLLS
ncbi:hypothetical protein ABPG72_008229 [Tetrahymena utriculariae]